MASLLEQLIAQQQKLANKSANATPSPLLQLATGGPTHLRPTAQPFTPTYSPSPSTSPTTDFQADNMNEHAYRAEARSMKMSRGTEWDAGKDDESRFSTLKGRNSGEFSSGYGLRGPAYQRPDEPLPPEEERIGPDGSRHRMYPAKSPIAQPTNINDGWPAPSSTAPQDLMSDQDVSRANSNWGGASRANSNWGGESNSGRNSNMEPPSRQEPEAPSGGGALGGREPVRPAYNDSPPDEAQQPRETNTSQASGSVKNEDHHSYGERPQMSRNESSFSTGGALSGWAAVVSANKVDDCNKEYEELLLAAGRGSSFMGPSGGHRGGMGGNGGGGGFAGRQQDSGWGARAGGGGFASRQQDSGWGSHGGDRQQDSGWGSVGQQQDSGLGSGQDSSWGGGGQDSGNDGWARDAPPHRGGGGGDGCYGCGEPGHIRSECPNGPGGGPGACYNCGEHGHMRAECPKGGGSGSGCFGCGEPGHIVRKRAECPNGRSGGGGGCFGCGEPGHIRANCPNPNSGGFRGTCHGCGEQGHMCPNGSGNNYNSYGGRGNDNGNTYSSYGGRNNDEWGGNDNAQASNNDGWGGGGRAQGNNNDDGWGGGNNAQPTSNDDGWDSNGGNAGSSRMQVDDSHNNTGQDDGWGSSNPASPAPSHARDDSWGAPPPPPGPTASNDTWDGNGGGATQNAQDDWGTNNRAEPARVDPPRTEPSSNTPARNPASFVNPDRLRMIEQETRRSAPVRQPGGPSSDNNRGGRQDTSWIKNGGGGGPVGPGGMSVRAPQGDSRQSWNNRHDYNDQQSGRGGQGGFEDNFGNNGSASGHNDTAPFQQPAPTSAPTTAPASAPAPQDDTYGGW